MRGREFEGREKRGRRGQPLQRVGTGDLSLGRDPISSKKGVRATACLKRGGKRRGGKKEENETAYRGGVKVRRRGGEFLKNGPRKKKRNTSSSEIAPIAKTVIPEEGKEAQEVEREGKRRCS